MMLLSVRTVLTPKEQQIQIVPIKNHVTLSGESPSKDVKRVPLHNNSDLEHGWQTSICHPSDRHQGQTVQDKCLFIPVKKKRLEITWNPKVDTHT